MSQHIAIRERACPVSRGLAWISRICQQPETEGRTFLQSDMMFGEQPQIGGNQKHLSFLARNHLFKSEDSPPFAVLEAGVSETIHLGALLLRAGRPGCVHLEDIDGKGPDTIVQVEGNRLAHREMIAVIGHHCGMVKGNVQTTLGSDGSRLVAARQAPNLSSHPDLPDR